MTDKKLSVDVEGKHPSHTLSCVPMIILLGRAFGSLLCRCLVAVKEGAKASFSFAVGGGEGIAFPIASVYLP